MAAPAPTARISPTATLIGNGFGVTMTFSADTNIELKEVKAKPPGWKAPDLIDISTSHNVTYRTKVPGALIEGTESTVTGRYDPLVYNALRLLVNVPQTFTFWWPPNDDNVAFFGVITGVEYSDLEEGSPPEVTVTIMPTQYDPVGCVEAGPVYANGSGTSCN